MTRCFFPLACRKKGCCKSLSAVGLSVEEHIWIHERLAFSHMLITHLNTPASTYRLAGFFCKQSATKSSINLEYLCALLWRSSVGGASCSVFMSTLTGGNLECGARPEESSSAVMPKLQMSAEIEMKRASSRSTVECCAQNKGAAYLSSHSSCAPPPQVPSSMAFVGVIGRRQARVKIWR